MGKIVLFCSTIQFSMMGSAHEGFLLYIDPSFFSSNRGAVYRRNTAWGKKFVIKAPFEFYFCCLVQHIMSNYTEFETKFFTLQRKPRIQIIKDAIDIHNKLNTLLPSKQ